MLRWFPMAELIFTDTDSLYYWIKAHDVEEKLYQHREYLDYSDYPADHKYHDPTNKLKIGKFKCETKGASIIEIVALRPKMYSILMRKDTNPASQIVEKQRIKGISRATARDIRHQQYLDQLHQPIENYQMNRRIGHKSHQLYSFEVFSMFYFELPILASVLFY
jgi:hypothetical protein